VRRARILIIDDGMAALGTALRRALAQEHVLVTVSNAREATALLDDGIQFDLILSDRSDEVDRYDTPVSVVDKPFDPAALRALIRARGWRSA